MRQFLLSGCLFIRLVSCKLMPKADPATEAKRVSRGLLNDYNRAETGCEPGIYLWRPDKIFAAGMGLLPSIAQA